MAKLRIGRVLDLSEHRAVAYGRVYPEFWIQAPHDRQHAQTANGAPGPRPHYGKKYYGCFVCDLDGHKIEAMAWLAG
ncbi:hypothetical protein [Neisseria dumasiana]|uniref:hypothetical protein n=1 Tax=Neisseria dumasiana TaxID=1931275 RepID=UPI001FCF8896|nr:hypothetical protein [Neisseria dumasiana]